MTESITKYAAVFPGQGSQSVGMLDGWQNSDITAGVLLEASDALGYDMHKLITTNENNLLDQTAYTQPALLTAGYIAWLELKSKCDQNNWPLPSYMAGHSLGEYTALVAAGVLSFAAALELVQFRGQCMQEAVPLGDGAMAAILGLDDAQVIEACELASAEGVVSAVNFNSPGQVVIAGEKEAVNACMTISKDLGAKRALPLPVSVPSHCVLMKPASERLAERMRDIEFSAAEIPVVQNADASIHAEPEQVKITLVKQLYLPVRWVECMQYLVDHGVNQIFECGPGKVLSGLQRRIDRSVKAAPVFDIDSLDRAVQVFTDKE